MPRATKSTKRDCADVALLAAATSRRKGKTRATSPVHRRSIVQDVQNAHRIAAMRKAISEAIRPSYRPLQGCCTTVAIAGPSTANYTCATSDPKQHSSDSGSDVMAISEAIHPSHRPLQGHCTTVAIAGPSNANYACATSDPKQHSSDSGSDVMDFDASSDCPSVESDLEGALLATSAAVSRNVRAVRDMLSQLMEITNSNRLVQGEIAEGIKGRNASRAKRGAASGHELHAKLERISITLERLRGQLTGLVDVVKVLGDVQQALAQLVDDIAYD